MMVRKIPFVKMHGLGNDFVFIDQQVLSSDISMRAFASQVANRRLGIGCDQLIVYAWQSDQTLMRVYNQDGSSAEICGNAARCLTRLIFDVKGQTRTIITSNDRAISCDYLNPKAIQVNMGVASFQADWMPSLENLWQATKNFAIDLKEMICVDMGNPHLVIFATLTDHDIPIIGELLQKVDCFKGGINVNFATIIDDKIKLQVWERGTGLTLACGSGACATYAAAYKLGFVGQQSEVVFAHGVLQMHSNESSGEISMCGPAEYIAQGEYIY